jgi:fructose-specific phosphotransferase system IIC component
MNKPKLTAVLVLVVSAAAVRANAQAVGFSAGVGGTKLTEWSDFLGTSIHSVALDGRVSVSLTDRFALEPGLVARHVGGDSIVTPPFIGLVVGGVQRRVVST